MTVETRYMRSDTHTINGLYSYKLLETATTVALSADVSDGSKLGIRVWKRSSAGVETEISGGVPVAQVDFPVASGYVNSTWSCPETSLVSTDSIVVRVYKLVGALWVLVTEFETGQNCVFQTLQLGSTILNASTWTVYYWFDVVGAYYGFIWGGSLGYGRSRIENFKYGEVVAVVKKPVWECITRGYQLQRRMRFYPTLQLGGSAVGGAGGGGLGLWDSWDQLWVAVL